MYAEPRQPHWLEAARFPCFGPVRRCACFRVLGPLALLVGGTAAEVFCRDPRRSLSFRKRLFSRFPFKVSLPADLPTWPTGQIAWSMDFKMEKQRVDREVAEVESPAPGDPTAMEYDTDDRDAYVLAKSGKKQVLKVRLASLELQCNMIDLS